jgi:hypothetical protein
MLIRNALQIAYTAFALIILNVYFFSNPVDAILKSSTVRRGFRIFQNELTAFPFYKNKFRKVQDRYHQDLRNLYTNLTVLVAGGFTTAFFHIRYKYFFMVLMTIFVYNLLLKRGNFLKYLASLFSQKTLCSICVAVFAYAPALLNSLRNNQFLGMTSQRNNDVGFYALVAKEFLRSGLKNSARIENLNTTDAVVTQHQTANQLVAFSSELFHLHPYECMNIVMLFILFLTSYLFITVVQAISSKISLKVSTLISCMVLCSPIIVYIDANYFLGEATSFLITLGLFTLALDLCQKKDLGDGYFALLTVLTTLSLYTYPVFLIPYTTLMLIFLMIVSSATPKKRFSLSSNQFFRGIIVAVMTGILLALPYLYYAWKLIALLSRGSFGWSIRPIDPLSIFIRTKFIDFSKPSIGLEAFGWIIAISILTLLVCLDKIIPKIIFMLLGIFILLICFNTYAIGKGDWGHYQNWKLITYFMPVFLIVFYTSLTSQKSFFFKAITFLLIVLQFSVPWVSWKDMISGRIPSNVLTRDQLQPSIINTSRFGRIKDINVSMPSWFETMAMANILDTEHIYLNSNSYIPPMKNPNICTLQHLNPTDSSAIKIGLNYELLKVKNAPC